MSSHTEGICACSLIVDYNEIGWELIWHVHVHDQLILGCFRKEDDNTTPSHRRFEVTAIIPTGRAQCWHVPLSNNLNYIVRTDDEEYAIAYMQTYHRALEA